MVPDTGFDPDAWSAAHPSSTPAAAWFRVNQIIQDYDTILLSISGGKDSALSAMMVWKAWSDAEAAGLTVPEVIISTTDCEIMWKESIKWLEEFWESTPDSWVKIWKCLPLGWQNITMDGETSIISWDPEKESEWVRPKPSGTWVWDESNWQKKLAETFGTGPDIPWKAWKMSGSRPYTYFGQPEKQEQRAFAEIVSAALAGKRVCNVVSLRAEESPNRLMSLRRNADPLTGKYGVVAQMDLISPLLDVPLEDLWWMWKQFGWQYPKIYNLLYQAGVRGKKQRVGSLLNYASQSGLQALRVVDAALYNRLQLRFKNVDFLREHGKQYLYNLKRPDHLSWMEMTLQALAVAEPESVERWKVCVVEEMVKQRYSSFLVHRDSYQALQMLMQFPDQVQLGGSKDLWKPENIHVYAEPGDLPSHPNKASIVVDHTPQANFETELKEIVWWLAEQGDPETLLSHAGWQELFTAWSASSGAAASEPGSDLWWKQQKRCFQQRWKVRLHGMRSWKEFAAAISKNDIWFSSIRGGRVRFDAAAVRKAGGSDAATTTDATGPVSGGVQRDTPIKLDAE